MLMIAFICKNIGITVLSEEFLSSLCASCLQYLIADNTSPFTVCMPQDECTEFLGHKPYQVQPTDEFGL